MHTKSQTYVKKAKKWLDTEKIEYQFHDYRKQGIDAPLIETLCNALGWENIVNKRGTTYRQTRAVRTALRSSSTDGAANRGKHINKKMSPEETKDLKLCCFMLS